MKAVLSAYVGCHIIMIAMQSACTNSADSMRTHTQASPLVRGLGQKSMVRGHINVRNRLSQSYVRFCKIA